MERTKQQDVTEVLGYIFNDIGEVSKSNSSCLDAAVAAKRHVTTVTIPTCECVPAEETFSEIKDYYLQAPVPSSPFPWSLSDLLAKESTETPGDRKFPDANARVANLKR